MAVQKSNVLSEEKQLELMYNDFVSTLEERKRTQFDLTRWIVTLQGLVIGFAAIQGPNLGPWFSAAPIVIGFSGFILNRAIQMEMTAHRIAMAELRKIVGGYFVELDSKFVEQFSAGRRDFFSYWRLISNSHAGIILVSSLIASSLAYFLSV